jgi:hypothetical protein
MTQGKQEIRVSINAPVQNLVTYGNHMGYLFREVVDREYHRGHVVADAGTIIQKAIDKMTDRLRHAIHIPEPKKREIMCFMELQNFMSTMQDIYREYEYEVTHGSSSAKVGRRDRQV